MTPLLWTDPWFRRVFPPLLAVLLTLLGLWLSGVGVTRPAPSSASVSRPVPVAATPAPAPLASVRIRETAGFVGPVRLGWTVERARLALGEPLVSVQEPTPGSSRFELLARHAGLRLHGKHQTIDKIVVTSVGEGRRFKTTRGIGIGHRSRAVSRAYTWAYKLCGREWWVKRGKYTLRFTAERRVTAITLTSQRAPTYVDCT